MDFSLSPEERQIRDTVRSFIEKEIMPLEPEVLRKQLKLTGSREVTVVLTSAASRQVAMVVRPESP